MMKSSQTNCVPLFLFLQVATIFLISKLPSVAGTNPAQFPGYGSSNVKVAPPHCSRAIITTTQSSKLTKRDVFDHQQLAFADTVPTSSQVSINIGVDQSICFRLSGRRRSSRPTGSNSSSSSRSSSRESQKISAENSVESNQQGIGKAKDYLYTLSLTDVEQQHSITERYPFAIPEMESKCICECESTNSNCLADDYMFGSVKHGSSRCGSINSVVSPSNENPPNKANLASACYRTFHANQPMGAGCSNRSAAAARLCCDLRFRPLQGRSFTAIRLERPTSYATLLFTSYRWNDDNSSTVAGSNGINRTSEGWWSEMDQRRILIQLDGFVHNVVLNEDVGLKLSILGLEGSKSGINQLTPGMYYVENLKNEEYGEITGGAEINRINENYANKLGWFRLNNGMPMIQFGEIFLDSNFKVKAENCVEQRYHSILNAAYYINNDRNDSTQYHLEEPLSKTNSWIKSARLSDNLMRLAVVKVVEGITLEATLTVSSPSAESRRLQQQQQQSTPRGWISFVHNTSKLGDFDALIFVDSSSRSLLNITVYDASGVLNGYIRQNEGEDIESFTIHVPSSNNFKSREEQRMAKHFEKTRPITRADRLRYIEEQKQRQRSSKTVVKRIRSYPIHTVHEICLRPDDAGPEEEICHPVLSIHYDLAKSLMRNEWTTNTASCPNCNQINMDGFKWFLNPANWTKGVSSVSEALMLVSDVFGYLFVLIAIYVVVTKVVMPLVNCCCCLSPTRLFFARKK